MLCGNLTLMVSPSATAPESGSIAVLIESLAISKQGEREASQLADGILWLSGPR